MLVRKHIRLDGKKTTIEIEPEFWDALTQVATYRGITKTELLKQMPIRHGYNRMSSLRIFILEQAKGIDR